MKFKFIFAILLTFSILSLVFAENMTLKLDDDDCKIYTVDVPVKKGWNLLGGLLQVSQVSQTSEVSKENIVSIYHYSNTEKKYFMTYPIFKEFDSYLKTEDSVCGDSRCTVKEQTLNNWCPSDCSSQLNSDVMSKVNSNGSITSKENYVLKENERKILNSNSIVELYWTKGPDYLGEGLVLNYKDKAGNVNTTDIYNTPNDGNPNNDDFGIFKEITSTTYIKVDYFRESKTSFTFSVYELKKSIKELYPTSVQVPLLRKLLSNSNWVNVNKDGKLSYEACIIPLEYRPIYKGWNFISLTPEMIGKTIDDFKGNCNLSKGNFWDAISSLAHWEKIMPTKLVGADVMGYGLLVKAENDCSLGLVTSNNIAEPPAVPLE